MVVVDALPCVVGVGGGSGDGDGSGEGSETAVWCDPGLGDGGGASGQVWGNGDVDAARPGVAAGLGCELYRVGSGHGDGGSVLPTGGLDNDLAAGTHLQRRAGVGGAGEVDCLLGWRGYELCHVHHLLERRTGGNPVGALGGAVARLGEFAVGAGELYADGIDRPGVVLVAGGT